MAGTKEELENKLQELLSQRTDIQEHIDDVTTKLYGIYKQEDKVNGNK